MKHSHQGSRNKGQWNGCAAEAYTSCPRKERRLLCSNPPEAKIRRQDGRLAWNWPWLTQYQLLWPWLAQCQLLRPAQSKSSRSTQNNNKANTKTSTRKNGKRGRMPVTAEEKKKKLKKKKNGAQLPLTRKTSPPFIEVALARSPRDSKECG